MCALSPGTCAKFGNDFYADDEEALWAYADAMREEYMAIVDAGLIVQLDDPGLSMTGTRYPGTPPRNTVGLRLP